MDVYTGTGSIKIQASTAKITVGLNDGRQVAVDNTIVPGIFEMTGSVKMVSSVIFIN